MLVNDEHVVIELSNDKTKIELSKYFHALEIILLEYSLKRCRSDFIIRLRCVF